MTNLKLEKQHFIVCRVPLLQRVRTIYTFFISKVAKHHAKSCLLKDSEQISKEHRVIQRVPLRLTPEIRGVLVAHALSPPSVAALTGDR